MLLRADAHPVRRGVMNLAVIVALTVWAIIEKLAPFGEQSARVGGALLIALAGWILFR